MMETEAEARDWLLTQPKEVQNDILKRAYQITKGACGEARPPKATIRRAVLRAIREAAVDRALRANAGRVTLEDVARELGKPVPLPKAEEMRIAGSLTALGLTKWRATVWELSTPGAPWSGAADHQRRSATPSAHGVQVRRGGGGEGGREGVA